MIQKSLHIFFILFLISYYPNNSFGQEPSAFHFNHNQRALAIPIEIYNNFIIVHIRINDSFELPFILDTGVKNTILTEASLKSILEIKKTRTCKVIGLGEKGEIIAELALDVKISLSDISGTNQRLVILPEGILSFTELLGKQVYGIIGYDLLKDFIVEINYESNYLHFFKADKYRFKAKKYQQLPINMQYAKPYVDVSVRNVDGSIAELSLLIDTGSAQAISLSKTFVELPEKTIPTLVGTGISGSIYGQLGRVKSVTLGDLTMDGIIACYPDSSALIERLQRDWQGSLGGELLKRFHIVLDYPNQRFGFRRNNNIKKPFFYNLSGISLFVVGEDLNQYVVSHVRKGSSADVAGIKAGDLILSIDGWRAIDADMNLIYDQLNKRVGKKIRIKLMRAGLQQKVRMVLFEDI